MITVADLERMELELREQIANEIRSLPDNPCIKRISNNIFVINLRDFDSDVLCPFYYDFRSQFEYLADFVMNKSMSMRCIINDVQDKLKKGRCSKGRLHPEVIEAVNRIISKY